MTCLESDEKEEEDKSDRRDLFRRERVSQPSRFA